MGELEWTNDVVVRLMAAYRARPELWDPQHEMYRVHTLKYESWRALAAEFHCDVADLRKKFNSLFASHRREKSKVRAGGKSHWFLYPHMSFLPTHLGPDTSATSLNDYDNDHDDDDAATPTHKRPRVKARAPIKEASPPTDSEEEQECEGEGEGEGEAEFLEEEGGDDEEVFVKRELLPPPSPPPHPHPPAARAQRRGKPRARATTRRQRALRGGGGGGTDGCSNALDGRLSAALKLLRRAAEWGEARAGGAGGSRGKRTRTDDECDSFGEYIADALRKHDERTQAMIKQAINNILFEQEMKRYGAPPPHPPHHHQQFVVISAPGLDDNPLILHDEQH